MRHNSIVTMAAFSPHTRERNEKSTAVTCIHRHDARTHLRCARHPFRNTQAVKARLDRHVIISLMLVSGSSASLSIISLALLRRIIHASTCFTLHCFMSHTLHSYTHVSFVSHTAARVSDLGRFAYKMHTFAYEMTHSMRRSITHPHHEHQTTTTLSVLLQPDPP